MGSVGLIMLAIGLVTILDKLQSPTSQSTDVRARAGVTNTLKFVGLVSTVDETQGTVEVSSLQFDQSSLSGEATNLGTWIVTPPSGFNLASLTPGMTVTIGVNAKKFLATSHTVTALTIVPLK